MELKRCSSRHTFSSNDGRNRIQFGECVVVNRKKDYTLPIWEYSVANAKRAFKCIPRRPSMENHATRESVGTPSCSNAWNSKKIADRPIATKFDTAFLHSSSCRARTPMKFSCNYIWPNLFAWLATVRRTDDISHVTFLELPNGVSYCGFVENAKQRQGWQEWSRVCGIDVRAKYSITFTYIFN